MRALARGWPTRDGVWWSLAALGLGLAAMNTGNNLVYLLSSMLLALMLVSMTLSELALRGLTLTPVVPEEVFAARPALFGCVVANGKRRWASYSVSVEVLAAGRRVDRVLHLPWLPARAERVGTWEATFPARGRHRLPGVRLTTRFPFGLFVKTRRVPLDGEVLVFPAVHPVAPERLRQAGGLGDATTRRRGRGHDLYNLRQYRPGDDPRLIHWRSSAKTQTLTVRELEEDSALDTRIVLEGRGADPPRLEAGLSEAASLACHLLRSGVGVELTGAAVHVPLGRGRGQERRILTALALYEDGTGAPPSGGGRARIRELCVALS
ncbi:MAG: DUF58 domain-containing protein [Candidatus Rokuibacteriota bacterium]